MVELPQVRQRHVQRPHRRRLIRQVQRWRYGAGTGPSLRALEDTLDVVTGRGAAPRDGALQHFRRLLGQQLHHAQVVLDAAPRPMLSLQVGAQLGKERRQLPAAEDGGMIQRRRLAFQRLQVMLRIETLLVLAIRPGMLRDHLAGSDHRDVVHIPLDRDRLKRGRPRHAVAVVVEAHRLVLVHLARLEDARIKRERRQRQGVGTFAGEALADRLGLPGLGTVAIAQRAGAQVGVQFGAVVDVGHGCGPVALQEPDPALNARLLLRPAHQAEPGLEHVMTGQGLVAVIELPLTAGQQVRRHGLGVVPPEFVRHAAEEGEGFDQAVKDGLGAFARQRQGEGAVGISPGDE